MTNQPSKYSKEIAPEIASLKLGDEVIVIEAKLYTRAGQVGCKARIVKAARIWLDIKEDLNLGGGYSRVWRMRRDTQYEGGEGNYLSYFLTPAQYVQQRRAEAARKTIDACGIQIAYGEKWQDDPKKLIALAEALKTVFPETGETKEGE
jgi:hypothetical protein